MSAFVSLLKVLPVILKLTIELIKIIQAEQSKANRKKKIAELKSAVSKARIEKDTSDLERFFNKNVRARDTSPPE